ncbi:MAG: hypothetical protein ACI9UA_001914 [Pseudoalteromonas tetraodonis]|jgi:hypothetical protein
MIKKVLEPSRDRLPKPDILKNAGEKKSELWALFSSEK